MTQLKPGWFQTTWFPSCWWQEDYWLEYGTAAAPNVFAGGGNASEGLPVMVSTRTANQALMARRDRLLAYWVIIQTIINRRRQR